MKKGLSMKKKIKATVTTATTAGILLTSITPSFAAEEQERKQYKIQENQNQSKEKDELTDAEGKQLQERDNAEKTSNSSMQETKRELSNENQSEANVKNFTELKKALLNKDITSINVTRGMYFTEDITNVPARDLMISGGEGIELFTQNHKITIDSNVDEIDHMFTIKNLNISTSGDFIEVLNSNDKKSSIDMLFNNVNVSSGGNFIDNKEGTIIFEGNNSLDLESRENGNFAKATFAKVDQVKIKPASNFKVINNSALETCLFDFVFSENKKLEIGNSAELNLVGNTIRDPFQGLSNLDVGENAKFNSSSLQNLDVRNTFHVGKGAQVNLTGDFLVRLRSNAEMVIDKGANVYIDKDVTQHQNRGTTLIIDKGAIVNVNDGGTLDVKAPAWEHQNSITLDGTINVNPNGNLHFDLPRPRNGISGTVGAISGVNNLGVLVLNKPNSYSIESYNSNLLSTVELSINDSDITVSNRNEILHNWEKVTYFTTFVNHIGVSSETLSSDKDLETNFQALGYRKIAGQATVTETIPEAPKVNEVKDTDEKVTGQAKKGSKVIVKAGDQEIGTGVADETGSYSIAIPKQKAGTKLQVTASNSAGTSEVTEVTVQATQLKAPQVNKVKDTDEKVTGQGEANAEILVVFDMKVIGSGKIDDTGYFNVPIPKQSGGTKLVIVTHKDGIQSAPLEVTVQATETIPEAPQVNEVKDTDEKVTGQAKKGSKVSVKVGDQELGTGEVDETGKYSVTIPKQKTGTKLQVTASNSAGTSEVTEVTVQATETIPEAPKVNEVKDTDEKVTGQAKKGSKVIVKAGDQEIGTGVADETGSYSIAISKQKVGTKLQVTASNSAGTSEVTEVTVQETETIPEAPEVNEVKDTDEKVTG
ncbi:Ig-like domain-containing protein, partial [Bacillus cereus]